MRSYAIAVLPFILAVSVFGQSSKTDCPDVKLIAPKSSSPSQTVRISAEIDESGIRGDWFIVKENFRSGKIEVAKLRNFESVNVVVWDTNDSGLVTAVFAAPPSNTCTQERYGATSVAIMENVGSPYVMDQFGELSRIDQKVRLERVVSETLRFPKHELLVFLSFPKTYTGVNRSKSMRTFILELTASGKLTSDRITFLIEDGEYFSVKFQTAPQNMVYTYSSMYIEIKAEKFAEYQRLFK